MARAEAVLRWRGAASTSARVDVWAESVSAWRAGVLSGNALRLQIEGSAEPAKAALAWLQQCEEPARFDIAWAQQLCERSADLVAASLLVTEVGVDPDWAMQLGLRLAPSTSPDDAEFWSALQDVKDWLAIRRRANARWQALVVDRQEAMYVARNH